MDFNTPFDYLASSNSREAYDVRFMYFSPEEVRSVSVHEINDAAIFDEWNQQLDRGLFAPMLGPAELAFDGVQAICKTCGLGKDCPGHLGHVELATVCYNPLMMGSLLKLLNHCCLQCRKLTSSDVRTKWYVEHLSRVAPGELAKKGSSFKQDRKRYALQNNCDPDEPKPKRQWTQIIREGQPDEILVEVPQPKSATQHNLFAEMLVKDCKAAAQAEALVHPAPGVGASSGSAGRTVSNACVESVRAVVGEYCQEMSRKCERCGTVPAKWRKEGFSALFLKEKGEPETMALPEFVRSVLKDVWANESAILRWVVPGARELGQEIYFVENFLVPPNRFRPFSVGDTGAPRPDNQTLTLGNILKANTDVRGCLSKKKKASEDDPSTATGETPKSLEDSVEKLQLALNSLMDSTKSGKHALNQTPGIRQLLEKKQGLFRMKMMGKRVNFSARSVISPDPNIETSEIGIPLMIAEELSYPEVAADHNAAVLRQLVERGARYPGATEVHIPMPTGGKRIMRLKNLPPERREGIAKQLITDIESGNPPMTVFRQLRDGDPLLVNRQPTLHKPGIMAHVAKIMRTEKTIRLHYVNCNTYNADFDGDEMNLHAPQDPIGRMEALNIAKADQQYLVPTSGKPLRGLIQDHCIAGAMLSKRDSYFSRSDVCLLLYAGMRAAVDVGDLTGDFGKGGSLKRPLIESELRSHLQLMRLQIDPPTIFRPAKLWTGKQVFSMLLKNLVELCGHGKGRVRGLHLESKSKTPGDIWSGKLDGNSEESSVLFDGMELLRGVLDKSQFGAASYGITHTLHELLGGRLVGMWLASLARMLTLLLQMRGFTCAFMDLLLTDEAEKTRSELIKGSRASGKAAVEGWLKKNDRQEFADGFATPAMLSEAASELLPQKKRAEELEGAMIGKMKENWSDMINKCIPIGQKLPFPKNCFSAMVQTGAKGSKVNQSQICCCLGQQVLEGRLPPLTCTFRSLPCFARFDVANRTRGYITDRFLTGIRPQEFFFHCMAGREGLVDTAVKTSRSGYLQRCLIKHLESLKVCYDLTVRDTDNSIVQFLYGEDGIDVTRSSYLLKFGALKQNMSILQVTNEKRLQSLSRIGGAGNVNLEAVPAFLGVQEALRAGKAKAARKRLRELLDTVGDLDGAARHHLGGLLERLKAGTDVTPEHLDPTQSVLSSSHFFGCTSEKHESQLREFLDAQLTKGEMTGEEAESFARSMRLKYMQNLAQPGEAVGVIAAQSMGEPSTQMTLNTFHLAGHGGANVTLGIPRLREIVQTASKSCSTPLMRVMVLRDEEGKEDLQSRLQYAQKIKTRFTHLKLMDCIRSLAIHEETRLVDGKVTWTYQCRFQFFEIKRINKKVGYLTTDALQAFMNKNVIAKLKRQMARVVEVPKATARATNAKPEEGQAVGRDGGDSDAERGDGDDDKPRGKSRKKARITGEEDKQEALEAMEAEAEADVEADDKKGGADDEDADSGMYSDSADEAEGGEAKDKAKGGDAEEGAAEGQDESGDDEAGAPDEADVFGEWDSAESDAEAKAKGKARDKAKAKPGGEAKEAAKAKGKPGDDAKAKDKARAAGSGAQVTAKGPFSPEVSQALASGKLVWNNEIVNGEMTIVVHHTQQLCAHSLFVGELLHKICRHARMQDPACKGVKKVHLKKERSEKPPYNEEVWLECEGINMYSMQVLGETVDHRRIYTNNLQRILQMYGVEAARAAVVREIHQVFGHYGIEVDYRHLTLIADYMAHAGNLRPFNRLGMAHAQIASPFQQMSYETTMGFMTAAITDGLADTVRSPSSAIVLGQLPQLGTGMVNLMVDLDPPVPKWKQKREFTF